MKIITSIILFMLFTFPLSESLLKDKNEGSVLYHANWIKNKVYNQEFIDGYPNEYKESLKMDSLLSEARYSVSFQGDKSYGSTHFANDPDNYLLNIAITQMDNDMMHSYNNKTGINTSLLNFAGDLIALTRNHQNAWKIDYSRTKTIDGYKCYYAKYKGLSSKHNSTSEPIYAWFTPEIPVPYGPAGYGGLPGLILELIENNISMIAVHINLRPLSNDVVMIESAKRMFTVKEYLEKKDDMRKVAKRLIISGNK
jgi:GLPGLI family protein